MINRISTGVSIPSRRVISLLPELADVERRVAGRDLVAQPPEKRQIDPSRPQYIAVRAFRQFELVAGAYS